MLPITWSRGPERGPGGLPPPQAVAPMSERQQLALVMQMSTQGAEIAAPAPAYTPVPKRAPKSEGKKRSKKKHHSSSKRETHSHSKKKNNHKREARANVGKKSYHAVKEEKDTHMKDNVRTSHSSRARDESGKKGGNASGNSESKKRNSMDCLAHGDHFDGKDSAQEKGADGRDGKNAGVQLSSGVVSSTQDEASGGNKKQYGDDNQDEADEEGSKRKKRKDNNDDKEPMAKPAPVARGGPGRVMTGSKMPGPASKTGGSQAGKGSSQGSSKGGGSGKLQTQGKGSGAGAKGKSSGGSKGSQQSSKQDRKSPVQSPKPHGRDDDGDDQKSETAAPKVPPLKIVIPGGAGGSGNRNEQEGGSGQRGSGKGRNSVSTLPYVIPCTSNDAGQTSDSSDGICDEKGREGGKAGQRVLRSHRTNDGEKDKERASPHTGSEGRSGHSQSALSSNKSPTPSGSARSKHHDGDHGRRGDTDTSSTVELHPRKRKIKASKDSHSRESRDSSKNDASESSASHNITHSNPYQMYIHIRKQIDRRQKGLFPVKPKPPKDFNKYLMNRCTYTLQGNVNPEPQIDIPITLPPQMVNEFMSQEKERTRLRIQHLVEKEKLVLAVEQEILRVHGRAERAVANQALPFSVCTMLRDDEVYNVLAPEQEEKRNAQRSRCNGRQINSWLQEVDDKWEKIKVGMLRRQHTEAETLHAVQTMGWEWKLKELGICDNKSTPKIDTTHVPQIHVSNFDLPA